MECKKCKQSISPGMDISVPGGQLQVAFRHCPYCLDILSSEIESTKDTISDVSVARHERRRETRAAFVDRLLAQSTDGTLRCPLCDHRLNKSDELILRNSEYFKCHFCCHDLATVAYRQEAYQEERWLPLVSALRELKAEKECPGCSYFGAIAKACQNAFSWMPGIASEPASQVAAMLRRSNWRVSECDVSSCVAVNKYQNFVGDALQML